MFQQDNSRVHTAKIIKAYFEDRDIYVLPWPSKSPDLNLIDKAWSMLKGGLKESYGSRAELVQNIQYVWKNLPSESIQKLYGSMKDRIRAVIEAKGGVTHY